MAMKPTLHHILFLRMPLALFVCSSAAVITFFFVPFSAFFVAIAVVVGVIHAIISIDELTGGKALSYFSLPMIIVAYFLASAFSFGGVSGPRRWLLPAHFMAIVLSTDSALTIMFRTRIEHFCNRRLSQ